MKNIVATYRTHVTPETLYRSAQGVLDLLGKADDINAYVDALDVVEDGTRGRWSTSELPADGATINDLVDSLYRNVQQLHDWHKYPALDRTQDDPIRATLEIQKWCLRQLDADARRKLVVAQQQAQEGPQQAAGDVNDDKVGDDAHDYYSIAMSKREIGIAVGLDGDDRKISGKVNSMFTAWGGELFKVNRTRYLVPRDAMPKNMRDRFDKYCQNLYG